MAICYQAQQLKIPCVCIMSKIAPIMKVKSCLSFGAIVFSYGNDPIEVYKNISKFSSYTSNTSIILFKRQKMLHWNYQKCLT